MHCWACGHDFEGDEAICPRCHADLTARHRRRALLLTVIYVLIAVLVVSVLTSCVLKWHDAQILQTLSAAEQAAG